jgi:hypothetical protein
MISGVPNKISVLLNLPNLMSYTFHSFRRTSATRAADEGATMEQLVDLFWLEKRFHVPKIDLLEQARYLGHGQQAWWHQHWSAGGQPAPAGRHYDG